MTNPVRLHVQRTAITTTDLHNHTLNCALHDRWHAPARGTRFQFCDLLLPSTRISQPKLAIMSRPCLDMQDETPKGGPTDACINDVIQWDVGKGNFLRRAECPLGSHCFEDEPKIREVRHPGPAGAVRSYKLTSLR